MKTIIRRICEKEQEQVIIECTEITPEIRSLKEYAKGIGNSITGTIDGKMKKVPLEEILYLEVVDEKVFAYLTKEVLEVKGRLYEYEENLSGKGFVRISKSALLHLSKMKSIQPSLNRKFIAELSNGEQLVISRQYAKGLKSVLLKGEWNR